MIRFTILAVAALLLSADFASAQHCRGVTVNGGYVAPQATYVAPQAFVAPQAYPTAYYNTYVGVPTAVYVVPGNPTVALNIYPGQFTIIQTPPPVNLSVTINGQKAEVKTEPPK